LASRRLFISLLAVLSASLAIEPALGQTMDPFYAGSYTPTSLGSVPGVPANYGGLVVKYDDPNTLLIGGNANTTSGKLYSVGLLRDANNHIVGFAGDASLYADAANNDGGVVYGPEDVLFIARYPSNEIGQTKPGSAITDKVVSLGPLGVSGSVGGLAFVPPGYGGAGQLKAASYSTGSWCSLPVSPDGTGTYDISAGTLDATISGGPEGIFYVPLGSPLFPNPSVLVSEYATGRVAAYDLDPNGNPIVATRRDFITGLSGAEGAAIDPLTGDFLFSTYGGGNQVVVVSGFVPEPATLSLLALGGLAMLRRRK
jgi:hypothetical protein